jgi:hypothetical protein
MAHIAVRSQAPPSNMTASRLTLPIVAERLTWLDLALEPERAFDDRVAWITT